MKHNYEPGDYAEIYFILFKNKGTGEKQIHAWSDDKTLIKFYLDFHKCDSFIVKKRYDKIENIASILDENTHDEINISYITIRNPDEKKRHKEPIKRIAVPITETEMNFIQAETNSCLSTRIGYHDIYDALKFLKPKYQMALCDIKLPEVAAFVINGKRSKFVESLQYDELMVLMMSFQDKFG